MYPSPDSFRAFASERQARFQTDAARARARRDARQSIPRHEGRRLAFRRGRPRAPGRA